MPVEKPRSPGGRPVAVLLAALLLASCASEPPLVPPAELKPVEPVVLIDLLWKKNIGESGLRRFDPLLVNDALYVANVEGEVSRRDRDTGNALWSVDIGLPLGGGVAGNRERIYVNTEDGLVQSLNAESGERDWSVAASSEVLVPVSTGFDVVLIRSGDGRLLAVDADSGRERWSVSYTPPALTLNGYSRPLMLDGGALVGLDDGRLVALNLDNGREIWESVLSVPSGRSEVERLVDVDAGLATDESAIYAVNYQGRLAKLEPGRGRQLWSVPMSSTVGLAFIDDTLIVVDEEDVVHALERSAGTRLWQSDVLRGRGLSPPAITAEGDVLVVDFEGYVHVLSAADGEVLGRRRVGDSAVRARPVPDGERFYLQSVDGSLAAIELHR